VKESKQTPHFLCFTATTHLDVIQQYHDLSIHTFSCRGVQHLRRNRLVNFFCQILQV
jgi:hypothetical protein